MPKADPDSLGFLLTDAARLARTAFERRIAQSGLGVTPGEARALMHVAVGEGNRQNVIAERMGVEPMTVCTYIDRLERAGLVERFPDPQDRRAKNVHTTTMADDIITKIQSESAVLRNLYQNGLEPSEREALHAALKIIRRNLQMLTLDKSAAAPDREPGEE